MIKTFRKKPVHIEAVQYTGDNLPEIVKFVGKDLTIQNGTIMIPNMPQRLFLHTLEGLVEVSRNDYIIKGIKGEFYPCKPDVFWATYEEVID